MKYYTYGRKKVGDEWHHPTGLLSNGSLCDVMYMANYYGTLTTGSLDIIESFDPTEITHAEFETALSASWAEKTGSIPPIIPSGSI